MYQHKTWQSETAYKANTWGWIINGLMPMFYTWERPPNSTCSTLSLFIDRTFGTCRMSFLEMTEPLLRFLLEMKWIGFLPCKKWKCLYYSLHQKFAASIESRSGSEKYFVVLISLWVSSYQIQVGILWNIWPNLLQPRFS